MFTVFTRTWWKKNDNWAGGYEPNLGRKHTLQTNITTEEEAIAICKKYNDTHLKTKLSRRAEFTES